ncbi:MAG TPA: hypothetical protein VNW71_10140 [Thermoanaerobaculia bacterium]|nr:hypothetical protein [Thermoanaerobaculia bacterium]
MDQMAPDTRGSLRLVSINLALLSSTIALGAIWIFVYTDWFLFLGSLLGVAGAFTFLANLLTENRKRELREAFEGNVLGHRLAGWAAGLVLASLLLFTLLTGTVLVRSLRDDSSRLISVASLDGGRAVETVRENLLPGRSRKKFILWRGLGREYRVKLSGLPAATIRIRPFARAVLDSPDDFLRQPVVLVRPTPVLSEIASQFPHLWLVVERKGKRVVRAPFSGKAVWLGCDADVAVPVELLKRWQLVAPPEAWLPPVAPDEQQTLSPGDPLRISIETAEGQVYGKPIDIVVKQKYRKEDFPLEVVLDVPHS